MSVLIAHRNTPDNFILCVFPQLCAIKCVRSVWHFRFHHFQFSIFAKEEVTMQFSELDYASRERQKCLITTTECTVPAPSSSMLNDYAHLVRSAKIRGYVQAEDRIFETANFLRAMLHNVTSLLEIASVCRSSVFSKNGPLLTA